MKGVKKKDQRKPGPNKCAACGFMAKTLRKRLCGRCYWEHRDDEEFARRDPGHVNSQTEAEIDAMIAEQMKCLPKWWDKDTRRMERLYPNGLRLGTGYF